LDLLDPRRRLALIQRLESLTSDGTLVWTAQTEYFFTASTDRFGFVLRSRDDDDAPPYILDVQHIERNVHVDLIETEINVLTEAAGDLNRALDSLYRAVKQKTFRLSDVVDELFEDLGEDEPF
jgi:hypothetical protein